MGRKVECSHLSRFSSLLSLTAFFSPFGRFLLFVAFAALFLRAFGVGWGHAWRLLYLTFRIRLATQSQRHCTWVSCLQPPVWET